MSIWHIHMLNARHGLTQILPEIRQATRDALAKASVHADIPDFDLIVRPVPGFAPPGMSIGGNAPEPGVVEITFDPARFTSAEMIRTLIHEWHHLIRWDGPGYGRSLGEALVSEGLAGHFVLQVLGGTADPWDATTPAERVMREAMNNWSRMDFDFSRWFLGKGDLRRWTGYGLGHKLIAEYLNHHPDESAASLAHVSADEFRPVMRRLAGSEKSAKTGETSAATDAEDSD